MTRWMCEKTVSRVTWSTSIVERSCALSPKDGSSSAFDVRRAVQLLLRLVKQRAEGRRERSCRMGARTRQGRSKGPCQVRPSKSWQIGADSQSRR